MKRSKPSKKALINETIYKGLGAINISQIKNWDVIKEELKWLNTYFTDSEYPYNVDDFAFGFTTNVVYDILNFSFTVLDENTNLINFPNN